MRYRNCIKRGNQKCTFLPSMHFDSNSNMILIADFNTDIKVLIEMFALKTVYL